MTNSVRGSIETYLPSSPLQLAVTVLGVSIGYAVAGLSGAAVGAAIIPIAALSLTLFVAVLVMIVVMNGFVEGYKRR